MPKKPITEQGQKYIEASVAAIKAAASLRDLYMAIYGHDPSRLELQQFRNRLNPTRSNPGADLLGLCIEHLPELHEMTLREFFRIRARRRTERSDE